MLPPLGPVADSPSAISALTPVARDPHRQRISDRVYDSLASAIQSLALPPGMPLSETELSQRLGISRTPLREALSRLSDQGLVRVAPQVGTSVSLIDLPQVEEATFIRTSLEMAAFELACGRAGSVANLREILVRQDEAVKNQDRAQFFFSDEALHQEIFRLSGFPRAWSVVRSSKLQLDRVRWLVLEEAVKSRHLLEEHERIVDMLESGDVTRGVRLVRKHAHNVLALLPSLQEIYPEYFTDG